MDYGQAGSNPTCLISRLPNTKGSGLRARSGTELPSQDESPLRLQIASLCALYPCVFFLLRHFCSNPCVYSQNTSTMKGLDRIGNIR